METYIIIYSFTPEKYNTKVFKDILLVEKTKNDSIYKEPLDQDIISSQESCSGHESAARLIVWYATRDHQVNLESTRSHAELVDTTLMTLVLDNTGYP